MQLSVLHKRFSLVRTDTKVDADFEPKNFSGYKFHMLMSWIQYHDFQLSILWFPLGHRILQTIAKLATTVYIYKWAKLSSIELYWHFNNLRID